MPKHFVCMFFYSQDEWLCLTCHTQRALGQLEYSGEEPLNLPVPHKSETQAKVADPKMEENRMERELTPATSKSLPTPVLKMSILQADNTLIKHETKTSDVSHAMEQNQEQGETDEKSSVPVDTLPQKVTVLQQDTVPDTEVHKSAPIGTLEQKPKLRDSQKEMASSLSDSSKVPVKATVAADSSPTAVEVFESVVVKSLSSPSANPENILKDVVFNEPIILKSPIKPLQQEDVLSMSQDPQLVLDKTPGRHAEVKTSIDEVDENIGGKMAASQKVEVSTTAITGQVSFARFKLFLYFMLFHSLIYKKMFSYLPIFILMLLYKHIIAIYGSHQRLWSLLSVLIKSKVHTTHLKYTLPL